MIKSNNGSFSSSHVIRWIVIVSRTMKIWGLLGVRETAVEFFIVEPVVVDPWWTFIVLIVGVVAPRIRRDVKLVGGTAVRRSSTKLLFLQINVRIVLK